MTGVNPLPKQLEIPAHLVPRGTPTARLLERERAKASFSADALAEYIHGREWLDRVARLLSQIEPEEAFDKSRHPYLGRSERFRLALRKEKRFVQLMQEHKWDKQDQLLAEWLIDMPGPFGLHKSMGLETLRSQTTEEQKKAFLEPAEQVRSLTLAVTVLCLATAQFKIICCYAQTELGHGSNVQGLETTATYDPATNEFVINTPTLTALKWWIGGLGRTASHAIVMAQLIVKGKGCGIQPVRDSLFFESQVQFNGSVQFFVPIRDEKTRKTLPGITAFDIAGKFGYQTVRKLF